MFGSPFRVDSNPQVKFEVATYETKKEALNRLEREQKKHRTYKFIIEKHGDDYVLYGIFNKKYGQYAAA